MESKNIIGLKLHLTQYAGDGRYTKHGHISIEWDAMPVYQKAWDALPEETKKLLPKGHAACGLGPVVEILLTHAKLAELIAKCGNDFYGPNGEIPTWRVCYDQLREKTQQHGRTGATQLALNIGKQNTSQCKLLMDLMQTLHMRSAPISVTCTNAMVMTLQRLKGKKQVVYQTRYVTELYAPLCRVAKEL